jgi:trans-2,3-dihydro-3-hydroxyanthranilate isomerase
MSSPQPRLTVPYRLCDVFTEVPLQGNQLAVFEDAGALTDVEMQALAQEMNLSETAFVIRKEPAVEQETGLRVRIFTTQEELPFAGHPTLGTAATVRRFFSEYERRDEIILDLNVGKVSVRFPEEQSSATAVYGEMMQPDPLFGAYHQAASVAEVLGLSADALAPGLPIQTVSTGLPFCIVPLRSLPALASLRIPQAAAEAYLSRSDARFFYCIVAGDDCDWRARMQFYNGEDPATGSAAGCAISYLVRHGLAGSNEQVHLQQGVEIGRRSDLFVRANREGDTVNKVRVGGSTVHVAKGLVFLE